MSELGSVFENIMALNRWSGDESKSGPGSTLSYTCNLRAQLAVFVRKFETKTFFDAPCGDFHWMKEVDFPGETQYVGGEIAHSLVEDNVRRYASASRRFLNFDIVADKFPAADVWFCRDCLFHLPNAYIFRALRNFCDSQIPLLMMTNHINATGFENADIEAGEFRLTDFYRRAFPPAPGRSLPDRRLCLSLSAKRNVRLEKRADHRGAGKVRRLARRLTRIVAIFAGARANACRLFAKNGFELLDAFLYVAAQGRSVQELRIGWIDFQPRAIARRHSSPMVVGIEDINASRCSGRSGRPHCFVNARSGAG